jgi:hypothetical protein
MLGSGRGMVAAAASSTTVPTRNETSAARIGPFTSWASWALIPAWNGIIAPPISASRR